jgi:hypothetical protein
MSDDTELIQDNSVLDLRPSKDSIIYQLLRLGLTFDHRDVSGETWTDYTNGVIATFENNQPTDVIFSDMDTMHSKVILISDLANITEIRTLRTYGAK